MIANVKEIKTKNKKKLIHTESQQQKRQKKLKFVQS